MLQRDANDAAKRGKRCRLRQTMPEREANDPAEVNNAEKRGKQYCRERQMRVQTEANNATEVNNARERNSATEANNAGDKGK